MKMNQLCTAVEASRRTVERQFHAARGHGLLTEVNLCRRQHSSHLQLELPRGLSLEGGKGLWDLQTECIHGKALKTV